MLAASAAALLLCVGGIFYSVASVTTSLFPSTDAWILYVAVSCGAVALVAGVLCCAAGVRLGAC